MIKIAVCDDEKEDRETLCSLLEMYQYGRSERIEIKPFESGEQLLMSEYRPDIVFLDIVMRERDGIQTGVEMKRKFPEIIIVYITVLDSEMITAMNHVHSFGYLIKPVNREELNRILFDAEALIKQNFMEDTITFLSEDHTLIELKVKDIYYFEYLSRKIKVVTKDKTYICIKKKIRDIADKMEKYNFAMSHQSFVVNLNYVNRISSGLLIMDNDDKVDLAQKRAAAFRKKLMEAAKTNDEYYSEQMKGRKEMMAVIHDVKKHLKVMEGLKQADELNSELKRYADSFENLITPLLDRQYCNNTVLNIILNDKVEYCKKNGIQFDIEIQEINIEFLEPVSITAIFDNILDNAVAACEKAEEKKIILKMHSINGFTYISLSNTFTGEIRLGTGGRPVSNKGKGHGIGLKNVEKALKAYSGNMIFSINENMFVVEITLRRP